MSKRVCDSPADSAAKARTGEPQPEFRTCTICCTENPIATFGSITPRCTHEPSICGPCVSKSIDLEVKGKGNATKIRCPAKDCPNELSYEDVQRQSDAKTFEIYDNVLFKRELQQMKGFRWCAHEGCGSGQLDFELEEGGEAWGRFMTCTACSRRTCLHHKCKWHTERTCKEYEDDARASEEVALLQFFELEGIKRCPDCGQAIEKIDGCDHMTCSTSLGCGGEFCMRCTASFKGPTGIWAVGNSAHHSSCPFYFP